MGPVANHVVNLKESHYGKEIYQYSLYCDSQPGKSSFSADMKKYLGMAAGTSTKWKHIGLNYNRLYSRRKDLRPHILEFI